MAVHHLISINEDQLRSWRGDHDELLANVGAAVVLVCLDVGTPGVTIHDARLGQSDGSKGSSISVRHIDQHEAEDFNVWAWTAGDSVGLADLADEDLQTLVKVVQAVRQSRSALKGEVADHP